MGSLKVWGPWGGVWGNPCPGLLRNVIVRYPDGQILETILMSGRVCEVSAAPQTFLFSSEADPGFEIRHPALQKPTFIQPCETLWVLPRRETGPILSNLFASDTTLCWDVHLNDKRLVNFIQQLLSSKDTHVFWEFFDGRCSCLNMEDRRQCVRGYWQFSFSSWHLSMAQVDLFGLFIQVEQMFDQKGWRPRPSGWTTPFFMTHHQIGFLVVRWRQVQMGQVPCLLIDFLT